MKGVGKSMMSTWSNTLNYQEFTENKEKTLRKMRKKKEERVVKPNY